MCLSSKNALSEFQSGFRKKHSTSTAIIKVLNDLMVSLDNKDHSAALFIDLSKAFDFVDHEILKQRLLGVGLSVNTVGWFVNYLSDRSQCINIEGITSSTRNVKIGVPQGSVLGPLLFILYINNIGNNFAHSSFHLYADDM